jgi:hemoglobin-like flavoprotein
MAQAGRKAQVWWSKSREEPWRAQAASPRQSKSNPNFGEIGSTQLLEQGWCLALFFGFVFSKSMFFAMLVFRDAWQLAESSVDPIIAADMTTRTQLIQRSFELTAERCEDLTPLVYRRLFREHPEAEPMFRREANDLVKGSMLALTIDAIMDFAGDRTGSFRMIQCEVQSHDAYGTPRELFGKFFGVIAETMREILGADWSPEIGEAWQQLLNEIDQFLSVPGSKPGID